MAAGNGLFCWPEVYTTSPLVTSALGSTKSTRRLSLSPLPFTMPGVVLFSIRAPTPDWGSLIRSTVARSRETSSTRPTSPAPVTTGMSTPTPSLSPLPIWTVNSKLLGAPSTTCAAIASALSTNGRSRSFFRSLFSWVAARAAASCPRAASRRRRSCAFSCFNDAALVTPSIQSPTGENTVSNAPAIGLTTSCAPPRSAEIGPEPRTSSMIRVTAVRTISARIVRRRFPGWYTTTGPLAPLPRILFGFQPPALRRSRQPPAPRRSVVSRCEQNFLEHFELLEALPRSEHDGVQRILRPPDGHPRLRRQPGVEPVQQRAAAGDDDALLHHVGGQLGRRPVERVLDRVADCLHGLLDGLPKLDRGHDDRLRQPGHEVAAADLRVELLLERPRTRELGLDVLGRALAERQRVLLLAEAHQRLVDLVPGDANRLAGHDPTERDDRDFRGAAADVDDHVAAGLVHGEAGADGGGHGLLDDVGRLAGARVLGRLLHGALFDAGDARRDADHHARLRPSPMVHPLDEVTEHLLADVEG